MKWSKRPNLTKIGISHDPQKRAATIQKSIGGTVTVVAVFDFANDYKVEQEAHRHFAKYNVLIHGDGGTEWFNISTFRAKLYFHKLKSTTYTIRLAAAIIVISVLPIFNNTPKNVSQIQHERKSKRHVKVSNWIDTVQKMRNIERLKNVEK